MTSKDSTQQSSQTSFTAKGEYVRKPTAFRDWITADGSSDFPAASGRYHLYVCLACPWAHRTLFCRKLKGLEDVISYTVVDWMRTEKGWNFTDKKPECELDTLNNCTYLRELYERVSPAYTGAISVPVLWDKKNKTIVSNESAEILRMLNKEFNEFCKTDEQRKINLYPDDLAEEIDRLNAWIYPDINNGVYKAGFAQSQEAYDSVAVNLFKGLDKAETILSKQRYLTGDRLTEADIRLFTTLVRFDMIYVGLFKCNKKRIVDYPNLWGYTRDIYQINGIADTVNSEHIQRHYQTMELVPKPKCTSVLWAHFGFEADINGAIVDESKAESLLQINPYGIVALGPDIDFTTPHNRENM